MQKWTGIKQSKHFVNWILLWPPTTLHAQFPTLQREIKFRANKQLQSVSKCLKSMEDEAIMENGMAII